MISAKRTSYTYLSGELFDDGLARNVRALANRTHRSHLSDEPGAPLGHSSVIKLRVLPYHFSLPNAFRVVTHEFESFDQFKELRFHVISMLLSGRHVAENLRVR